jgi:cytochrome b pre-mRNA-processing protein 3
MHSPFKTWVVALLAVGLATGLFVLAQKRLDRELSYLPEAERKALYVRTLETLRTVCSQAPGPNLAGYCREQADFVERFPECDGECHAFAARFASQPSR